MLDNLLGDQQLVFAEAISFELARTMPRPQAQAEVKRLCTEVRNGAGSLVELVERQYPDVDWSTVTTPAAQLGDAPRQAARFVASVSKLWVLAPSTVCGVNVSRCKKCGYATFWTQHRSQA